MLGASISVLSKFCVTGHVYRSVCAMYREFALGRGVKRSPTGFADSCAGDSGAPAYRIDSKYKVEDGVDELSQRTLVGIVSRGLDGVKHPFPRGCGGGGLYTALGTKPVLEWLDENNVEYDLSYELRD
jgi:hypothetical protein